MGLDKTREQIAVQQFNDMFIATWRNKQKFAGTFREKHGLKGDAFKWPISDGADMTERTAHETQPAPTHQRYDQIVTTFKEYTLNVVVDKIQQKLQEADTLNDTVSKHTGAIGRRLDQGLIDALDTTSSEIAAGTSNMTIAKLTKGIETLGNQNCPDVDRFCAMSYSQLASLLNDAQATNADYVGPIYSVMSGDIKNLLGLRLFKIGIDDVGSLPKTGDNRHCFIWQKEAVGMGFNLDPISWVTEDATKFNWLTLSRLSFGTNLLQKNSAGTFDGVVRILCDETK